MCSLCHILTKLLERCNYCIEISIVNRQARRCSHGRPPIRMCGSTRHRLSETEHKQKTSDDVSRCVVSPRIEAFAFADDLRVGIRTRLLCGISQGDLPLEITWTKDGRSLAQLPAVAVKELDTFSSVLILTDLGAVHSGYYQCHVRNAAGVASYGTHLYVQGKSSMQLVYTVIFYEFFGLSLKKICDTLGRGDSWVDSRVER